MSASEGLSVWRVILRVFLVCVLHVLHVIVCCFGVWCMVEVHQSVSIDLKVHEAKAGSSEAPTAAPCRHTSECNAGTHSFNLSLVSLMLLQLACCMSCLSLSKICIHGCQACRPHHNVTTRMCPACRRWRHRRGICC